MTTQTLQANFDGPRRSYFPVYQEEPITDIQRQTLTELISANFLEDERELQLLQLDELTSLDATGAINAYSMGRW